MTVNISAFESELKELIRKYGFTKETQVTDDILTLYLIACMRQYITNIHMENQHVLVQRVAKIMNIGKLNIWFGWVPLFHLKVYPKFSYFNGGCYWKFGIYWFKYLLEFSGPKKDKTVYKKISSSELDKIIENIPE